MKLLEFLGEQLGALLLAAVCFVLFLGLTTTLAWQAPAQPIPIGTFQFAGEKTCNVNWSTPAVADDARCGKANKLASLIELSCYAAGGTATDLIFRAVVCDEDGASCVTAGLEVELDALETNVSDSTPTAPTVDKNDWYGIDVVSLTASPTNAYCTLRYQQ